MDAGGIMLRCLPLLEVTLALGRWAVVRHCIWMVPPPTGIGMLEQKETPDAVWYASKSNYYSVISRATSVASWNDGRTGTYCLSIDWAVGYYAWNIGDTRWLLDQSGE